MSDVASVQFVSNPARLAGFSFAPERCALLLPQLQALLADVLRADAQSTITEEPIGVFSPADVAARGAEARFSGG